MSISSNLAQAVILAIDTLDPDGAPLVLAESEASHGAPCFAVGGAVPDKLWTALHAALGRPMDHGNHHKVRASQRVPRSPASPGRSTHLRMAQAKPLSRHGLQTNHRPAPSPLLLVASISSSSKHRKTMKLQRIILDYALNGEGTVYATTASVLIATRGLHGPSAVAVTPRRIGRIVVMRSA